MHQFEIKLFHAKRLLCKIICRDLYISFSLSLLSATPFKFVSHLLEERDKRLIYAFFNAPFHVTHVSHRSNAQELAYKPFSGMCLASKPIARNSCEPLWRDFSRSQSLLLLKHARLYARLMMTACSTNARTFLNHRRAQSPSMPDAISSHCQHWYTVVVSHRNSQFLRNFEESGSKFNPPFLERKRNARNDSFHRSLPRVFSFKRQLNIRGILTLWNVRTVSRARLPRFSGHERWILKALTSRTRCGTHVAQSFPCFRAEKKAAIESCTIDMTQAFLFVELYQSDTFIDHLTGFFLSEHHFFLSVSLFLSPHKEP